MYWSDFQRDDMLDRRRDDWFSSERSGSRQDEVEMKRVVWLRDVESSSSGVEMLRVVGKAMR